MTARAVFPPKGDARRTRTPFSALGTPTEEQACPE
jgi:hypothetical protein